MKKRLIIDNRTEEGFSNIVKLTDKVLPTLDNDKRRYQVSLIKSNPKDIYCMYFKNKRSVRLLFAYEELKQEELF